MLLCVSSLHYYLVLLR